MEDTDAAQSCSNPNATVQLDQSPFNNSCSSSNEKQNDTKLGVWHYKHKMLLYSYILYYVKELKCLLWLKDPDRQK